MSDELNKIQMPVWEINDEMFLIKLGAYFLEVYEMGYTFDEIADIIKVHSPILDYVSEEALQELVDNLEATDDESELHLKNRHDAEGL